MINELLNRIGVVKVYSRKHNKMFKLEKLLHRFFSPARLQIEIKDRFGRPVVPQEWFLVPFECIEEAIERIKDKSIQFYKYDAKDAKLVNVQDAP